MGTMTIPVEASWPSRLQAVLARCEADAPRHMTGGPCAESALRHLEDALGAALPSPYRLFLSRLGGGVYYLRHEIFGAHRVILHDIELVTDVSSFRTWLGAEVPAAWLPVHRAGHRIHALDLQGSGRVAVLGGSEPGYPDFTTFLEQVVR